MNIIVNLLGKFVAVLELKKLKTLGLIEDDKGLIRYLLGILKRYSVSNNNGYLKFENKKGEIYLHRIILEYYSMYDNKLKEALNVKGYEVNHINKRRWDNRLENLELVTKKGNLKHKNGEIYDDEIIITNKELLEIKNRVKKVKQYYADKKYLEKVSNYNIKYLLQKERRYCYDSKFFENLYIRFSNKTISSYSSIKEINKSIRECNILSNIDGIIKQYLKNTFFTYQKILDIESNYDIYRYEEIKKKNLDLVLKYYKTNKIFRSICNKYNLLDNRIKREDIKFFNHNILLDLFYFLKAKTIPFKFYKNDLFITIAINALITTTGKYKSIKVLYLLGMLKRNTIHYSYFSHSASSFIMFEYSDELFKNIIIPRSKELLDMNLSKITYTIIADNFGMNKANEIYKNKPLIKKYKRDKITINKLKDILKISTYLKEKLLNNGFINVIDLMKEANINEKDIKFVAGVLKNDKILKDTLYELNLVYTRLNKLTINNIWKYQEENNIDKSYLYYTQTKIVLKKLYVKNGT